jgi:uncharacterized Zn finger protein
MSDWEPDWEIRPRIRRTDGIRARSQRGAFATSWWASRWVAALEQLVDPSRLTRGRTYARQGQVVKLETRPGAIDAQVQGSRPHPYRVTIRVATLSDSEWHRVSDALAERAVFGAKLLAGEMPRDIEDAFAAADANLFPGVETELVASCSCPDDAELCKHAAAVCYLVGERFDEDPFLMFELRGRSRDEIMTELRSRRAPASAQPPEGESTGDPHSQPAATIEADADDPGRFWSMPAAMEDFSLNFKTSPVDALPVKQLGPAPFWADHDEFTRAMQRDYRAISDAARRLALGDD